MITVTEAQTWTALGVLAAAFFGMMTIVSVLFTRVLRTEIGGVTARIDGLRSEMTARFEVVNTRIDSLDRDIQGIISELGRG